MDGLDRMFHVLVRALRSEQPPADGTSFTAAELHDRILPYRHYRKELALESNLEYERTLMHLLSGSRGYLDVDERLRDVLGRELGSGAPDPARLREVADARCSVNPGSKELVPVDRPSGPTRMESATCRYCGVDLPVPRQPHFCPHCGQNLEVATCAACGAEVEMDWNFCVACGKASSDGRR